MASITEKRNAILVTRGEQADIVDLWGASGAVNNGGPLYSYEIVYARDTKELAVLYYDLDNGEVVHKTTFGTFLRADGKTKATGDFDLNEKDIKNIKDLIFKKGSETGKLTTKLSDGEIVLSIDGFKWFDFDGVQIKNVGAPTSDTDAATKKYVDDEIDEKVGDIDFSDYFKHDGSVKASENFDLNNNKIINLSDPTSDQDAATKKYIDDEVSSVASDLTSLEESIGDGKLTVAVDGIATVSSDPNFTANQKPNKTITITVPGTNLTKTVTGAKVTLNSSTGTGVDLPVASDTEAGVVIVGTQTLKGDKTLDGDIIISGSLLVQGDNFIAETETVKTKDDVIELRVGGTGPISTPAGIAINKYDGTNDGGIVMKSDGEVRVGKIVLGANGQITDSSAAQPILTREEIDLVNPKDGYFLGWNQSKKRAERSYRWATTAEAEAMSATNVVMNPSTTWDAISVAILDGGTIE